VIARGSAGAGEPDDREDAVGLLLVPGVARLGLGDLLPGLRAGVSVELSGVHPQLTAAELGPDLVRVRGDVVIPGWMMS